MFDYIKGTIERKTENYLILECGGIGYRMSASAQTLQNAGSPGSQAVVYTHLYVREGILELYGFVTAEERAAFELLISVGGVGPKAALNILSCISAAHLALAIVTNDTKAITRAQGVGPKLAQRIILELKDKIKNKDLTAQGGDFASVLPRQDDAADALIALGYTSAEAMNALKGLDDDLSIEEKIRMGLKRMARHS
jgi:Holliday junction DNA helicase RuvA